MEKVLIVLNANQDHNMMTLTNNSTIDGVELALLTPEQLSVSLQNDFMMVFKDDDYSSVKNHFINTKQIVRISYM